MAEQEGPPNDGATSPSAGGIKANLKKHWPLYVIGVGGAVLVLLFIVNNQSGTSSPIDTTGDNGNLYNGQSAGVDAQGTDSSLDSMFQGLTSIEGQNNQLLQTLANGGTIAAPVNIWPTIPDPPAIGATGFSKNRFLYTIQQGDTYASLTQKAGWANSRPDFLENYSGNAPIFQAMGINGPADTNKPLTPGYKVSL